MQHLIVLDQAIVHTLVIRAMEMCNAPWFQFYTMINCVVQHLDCQFRSQTYGNSVFQNYYHQSRYEFGCFLLAQSSNLQFLIYAVAIRQYTWS